MKKFKVTWEYTYEFFEDDLVNDLRIDYDIDYHKLDDDLKNAAILRYSQTRKLVNTAYVIDNDVTEKGDV
jgi:hypothetical protein